MPELLPPRCRWLAGRCARRVRLPGWLLPHWGPTLRLADRRRAPVEWSTRSLLQLW